MRKRKILLVDDNDISREMIRFILESRGWEVVSITAPFLFTTTLVRERPDIALIDLGLSSLSGDQLVRLARMNGRVSCPLVLHADKPADELRDITHKAGADGFIVKSGNEKQLVMNLEYFLRFGASRDSEPASSRGATDSAPPSSRRMQEPSSSRDPASRDPSSPASREPSSPASREPSGPPTSRRLSGSFEAVPPPRRRLSGSLDAVPPSSSRSGEMKPQKRPGSGLYQAVVAALEIPPSSTRDPSSSQRSATAPSPRSATGTLTNMPAARPVSAPSPGTPPASAPTPPAPLAREDAAPTRESAPIRRERTKTLS
ncbi:MAG: response regulator [Byssovorax sp.]